MSFQCPAIRTKLSNDYNQVRDTEDNRIPGRPAVVYIKLKVAV